MKTLLLFFQSGQVCCHYRSSCLDGRHWFASPTLFNGAAWVGQPTPSGGKGTALGSDSLPSLVHSTVATPPQAASGLGMGTDAHQAVRRQPRSTYQHQPSPTHTPPPTRSSPRTPAPLVAATKNLVGSSPMPHDVPETFTPLGATSDSEIAKTIILPNTWYRRLVYRNSISWIPSRKAQFFRERRERQRRSDP